MKNKLLLVGLVSSLVLMPCMIFDNKLNADAEELNNPAEHLEVLSYEDVFEEYYNKALIMSEGQEICSFNEFCNGYYDSELDLPTYTASVISEVTSDSTQYDVQPMASVDADYILSENDYLQTPAAEFQRVPVYEAYDYSVIKEGDIIFETETVLFNTGHNAIVYDMEKNSEYGNYIQTIEAVLGGVQFGFLDDTRIVDYKIKILRVVGASEEVVQDTKYFAYKQLGKEYFLNILRLNTDINSESWYCSELVYAAYKYAGIDIGVKKDSNGEDTYLTLGCIPYDIYNSYNVNQVVLHTTQPYFLEIKILSCNSKVWEIEVFNSTAVDITFEYNTKMCFKGDAQKWDNLDDVVEDTVPAYDSISISISENFLATSIALSRVEAEKRYVTYAYGLDKNDYSMNVEYTII